MSSIRPLARAAGWALALVFVLAGPAGASVLLPTVLNPQFNVIDMLNPDGSIATDGSSNPITGTLDPDSYTFDTSPSVFPYTTPATLNNGTIRFSNGANYNSGASGIPNILVAGWNTPYLNGGEGVQHAASEFNGSQPYFLFVNGSGPGHYGYLVYQNLGPAGNCLSPSAQYTLSVDIGLRSDMGSLTSGIVTGLYIGDAPHVDPATYNWVFPASLAGVVNSSSNPSPTQGSFATWTTSYTTPATIPTGDLYIILGTYDPGADVTGDQTDFTNVVISSPSASPEPASILLITCGALILLPHRWRRLPFTR
jgi:hypothetical protein